MAATHAKQYDPEKYWAERYKEMDISKSGHADLPVAYNAWLYRRKKERLLEGLRKAGFAPKGASVLEIAAGTGVYVEMWKSLGVARLLGIDISETATEDLKRRFPGFTFLKRDLSVPGLVAEAGKDFDLVTAVDMLYHIVDEGLFAAALRNLAEACRPGGLLAIHDCFLNHREIESGYHKLRSLPRYREALSTAGFEILSRTPTFFLTVQTYDVKSPAVKDAMDRVWNRFTHPAIERRPDLMGRLGYWSDRVLGALIPEGPSYEMMICRRVR